MLNKRSSTFSSSTLATTLASPSPLRALKEAKCCSAAANELTASDEPAGANERAASTDGQEREKGRACGVMWHLRESDREEREGYRGRDGRGAGGWMEEEKDGERKVG